MTAAPRRPAPDGPRTEVSADTFLDRMRRALRRLATPLLLGWFVLIDVTSIAIWMIHDSFGGNVQTYHAAAQTWLNGDDPWATPYATTFGPQVLIAPPPSLAPY